MSIKCGGYKLVISYLCHEDLNTFNFISRIFIFCCFFSVMYVEYVMNKIKYKIVYLISTCSLLFLWAMDTEMGSITWIQTRAGHDVMEAYVWK